MKTVTFSAHFDGEQIRLDEPFQLLFGTRLLVTIVPEPLEDNELQDWYNISKAGLARAYAEDEPDYPANLVRNPSPTIP